MIITWNWTKREETESYVSKKIKKKKCPSVLFGASICNELYGLLMSYTVRIPIVRCRYNAV